MSNGLIAFFKKCEELDLPMDICAYAYMEAHNINNTDFTPEKFYEFFEGIYKEDTIFNFLKKLVGNSLLLSFDIDNNTELNSKSILSLNVIYNKRLNPIFNVEKY